MLQKSKGLIISIVGIVIIYGVINLFLIGGQKIWHYNDNKKLEELKSKLDEELTIIQNYEYTAKKKNLNQTEYNDYSRRVDLYNSLVNQYNELAEEIGGTWYVIPVPAGKSK